MQFSSEVCAPCRRTHAVLAQLVSEHDDLSHVEMDVVEHLDLVRRFGIMRTPTTLLLDARGVVVGRMSGATDRRHALAALDSLSGRGLRSLSRLPARARSPRPMDPSPLRDPLEPP